MAAIYCSQRSDVSIQQDTFDKTVAVQQDAWVMGSKDFESAFALVRILVKWSTWRWAWLSQLRLELSNAAMGLVDAVNSISTSTLGSGKCFATKQYSPVVSHN